MTEHLSTTETTDYTNAVTLAHEANTAFDARITAAGYAATLLEQGHSPESADVDGQLNLSEQEDQKFKKLNFAANVLMPPRAAFERKDAKPTVPFATPEVWYSMTSEQRVKAGELRSALATSNLKEYGVTEDSLRVVMTNEAGKDKFTLIHTGNGVDIGDPSKGYDKARSYDAVMSRENNNLFKVEVNGVTYDTRTGMTAQVYDAKVADARERDVTLPDSRQLAEETGDDWTWTMLTGEPLTADGGVQIRYVYDAGVYRGGAYPDDDGRSLRVCPAVVVE